MNSIRIDFKSSISGYHIPSVSDTDNRYGQVTLGHCKTCLYEIKYTDSTQILHFVWHQLVFNAKTNVILLLPHELTSIGLPTSPSVVR